MESQKTNGSKILVTGGNGFSGYHIIKELNKRDCTVCIIDISSYREDIDASHYQTDLTNLSVLYEIIHQVKPEYVIHLAAIHYIPYCNEHPLETFRTNVMGTANLLAALPSTVRGIFASSSAAVYTPSRMPHSERSSAWPEDVYGFSKVAMEYLLRDWSIEYDIPVSIGRYFNMYGWGETTPHLIPVIVKQILDGSHILELGNVETRRDFVHVEDNARSTVDLLFSGHSGVVNLGSGISYSARNIVSMIGALHGIDLTIRSRGDKMRQSDRPNLVADMTEFFRLGLHRPRGIAVGLQDLLETGIGPYMVEQ